MFPIPTLSRCFYEDRKVIPSMLEVGWLEDPYLYHDKGESQGVH